MLLPLPTLPLPSPGVVLHSHPPFHPVPPPHPAERRPLFPGRTCYPLSADSAVTVHDRRDQLNTIFSIIGTPSPEDIAECESADVRSYLAQLPVRKRVNLATKYPGATPAAIDLLTRMLSEWRWWWWLAVMTWGRA